MEIHERSNLIRVLDKTIKAIKNEDVVSLNDLSNQTIHDATILQDEYAISFAVLVYTLSKLYERHIHYGQFKGWDKFCSDCIKSLEASKISLEKNNILDFEVNIKSYLKSLERVDSKLKIYIKDVLNKAKINKASRLYEHGLSVGHTAELLGISRYELMDYIGKTYIADVKENQTTSVKKRLETARKVFS